MNIFVLNYQNHNLELFRIESDRSSSSDANEAHSCELNSIISYSFYWRM